MNHTAYEEDFIPWVETQAALLRTICEQRARIAQLLKRYPSLQHDLADEAIDAYPVAIRQAAHETGLAAARFPAALPFTVDELLDFDFEP